ncbi:hypothetical protein CYY_000675 [Polysphondylium violaceum]|uniref:protein-tyrosine-phosphatase n=1 Tax=Polysphondylium violaceum TaxID=133409 RepID=A0A8J4Q3E8_9MYCE|nr:hypothetical protein CYY_000675 [Polysphondylium violaceum]
MSDTQATAAQQKETRTLNQQIEEEEGDVQNYTADDYSTPSEILPFLYLSGVGGTEKHILNAHNITIVVNVAQEFQTPRWNPDTDNITEHRVWIQDMVEEDQNQHQAFYQIFEIFDSVERNNQRVLIHCKHGRSRSATAVIAYLMYKNNWSLQKALSEVRSRRSLVGPHRHLTVQLIEWEKHFLKVQKASIPYPPFTFIKVYRAQKCLLM